MKQDTKETIGSRGTVAGFRPLIGEERWHRGDFTAEMLEGGWRPLLIGELPSYGDEISDLAMAGEFKAQTPDQLNVAADSKKLHQRTCWPLPQPQVETFEAHGHVWYRHVSGDAQPVEDDAIVEFKFNEGGCASARAIALKWYGAESYTIIGYRFPDFPAVHTTLQQQQDIVHVEKTEQSFQHDTTKQRLATMYHGWCDVAPDSVAECIADVAKVLYPTDADRCEAEFQKWWSDPDGVDSDPTAIWHAAWQAAKQRRQ